MHVLNIFHICHNNFVLATFRQPNTGMIFQSSCDDLLQFICVWVIIIFLKQISLLVLAHILAVV